MVNKGKKVFVGLSGGVDSAVSAALLKKEGYDVTGVFIKAWGPFDSLDETRDKSAQGKPKYPCTWREDRRSAMRVAAILDIPFLTLDLENEYKRDVVDYMIREYKEGRTPNPDVMCNKEIKFGHFLKFALDKSADFVATGHYARLQENCTGGRQIVEARYAKHLGAKTICRPREAVLLEGSDKNKDQSYFLWTLTQEQLGRVLFPVGHLQKSEVRNLAKKFALPQAARKDSQGLCFLGQIDMKEFLKEFAGAKKGRVLNEKGESIGEHEGAILYTTGERHGFAVSQKTDKEAPLYVIDKDIKQNTITVSVDRGPREQAVISDKNWISGKFPDTDKKYSCRIRYRQEKEKCSIKPRYDGKVGVVFDKSQYGITAGQSLVLYDGEICLGGGIIAS